MEDAERTGSHTIDVSMLLNEGNLKLKCVDKTYRKCVLRDKLVMTKSQKKIYGFKGEDNPIAVKKSRSAKKKMITVFF